METIDMAGSLVLPGLIDSHIHVGYMGECKEYAKLDGKRSYKA
jgi:imidazolonepropionase-like amidohydrolase